MSFTLNGGVEEEASKWQAFIVLETPDGRTTRIDSGFVAASKEEAEELLRFNIDRILKEFTTNHEVEVIAKNGVAYS